MWPVIGGILSGGASLLGGMMSASSSEANTAATNAQSIANQREAQEFNADQAAQNRAFQLNNSNTAYQRSSADMIAAGLNPAAMFGSGSAASTPGGGAASSSPGAPVQNPGNTSAGPAVAGGVKDAIGTAMALRTADATVNNLVEQNAKIKAETLTEHQRPGLVDSQFWKNKADAKYREASLPVIVDEALSAGNRSKMQPDIRRIADQAGYAGQKVGQALSPISNIVNSASAVKRMGPRRSTTETTRDDGSSSFSERFQY